MLLLLGLLLGLLGLLLLLGMLLLLLLLMVVVLPQVAAALLHAHPPVPNRGTMNSTPAIAVGERSGVCTHYS